MPPHILKGWFMTKLAIVTTHYNIDEPCLGLYEMNLPVPGKGEHRFQILNVIRADKIAECRIDMGLSKKIKADQFRIPGGVIDPKTGRGEILHTVGELRDIADKLRSRDCCDKRELAGTNNVIS